MVKYENIIQAIDTYIEKCSRNEPKNSSGLQNINPENTLNNGGLTVKDLQQIGEDISKRFNLEVNINMDGEKDIDETHFSLWDKENKTQINLGALIQHQDWVDFTNQGKSLYNIDEIIGYYTSMPNIMKKATPVIRFEDSYNGCYTSYEHNTITLASDLFIAKQKGHESYNVQNALYHECGHALEFKYSLLPPSEGYYISQLPEYKQRMESNNRTFASEYSKKFYMSNVGRYDCNFEDFAETVRMVAFDKMEDKSNAQLIRVDTLGGKTIPMIEDHSSFKTNHKDTYDFVKDILNDRWELHERKRYSDEDYWKPYKPSYQKLGLWD